MHYIEKIINLVTPVFNHIKYARTKHNENFYGAYEQTHLQVLKNSFELFSRKCSNIYYEITKNDYDNIANDVLRFNNCLKIIQDC